jgi:cation diffusion facilitator CzcD-associated flavoprotein CzcO
MNWNTHSSKNVDARKATMTLTELQLPLRRDSRRGGLPVAIIGAGPTGLAAAAHLAERGIDFVIYEKGDAVASSIASWGHTRLFSPWSLLVDAAAARLLAATGWQAPRAGDLPTGAELIAAYLEPLAAVDEIAPHIRYATTVLSVSRDGMDRTRSTGREDAPFLLRVHSANGVEDVTARAVIDASGTYETPNRLASSGLDPLGLECVGEHISHALPDVLGRDRARFAGRHTLVVGAGHSAANTLIALARLAEDEPGTTITWAIRNAGAVRVSSSDDDQLPARATLGGAVDAHVAAGTIAQLDRFEIVSLRSEGRRALVAGRRGGEIVTVEADVIVNATGFRPDVDMLREIRLDLDEVVEAPRRLAPLIDPNLHSCGTVPPHGVTELQHPEPEFFIAGMKSYGRAPTFLLATGYEQVRSIVSWLAGDIDAARRVELVLPATGVCSTDTAPGSSCCN